MIATLLAAARYYTTPPGQTTGQVERADRARTGGWVYLPCLGRVVRLTGRRPHPAGVWLTVDLADRGEPEILLGVRVPACEPVYEARRPRRTP